MASSRLLRLVHGGGRWSPRAHQVLAMLTMVRAMAPHAAPTPAAMPAATFTRKPAAHSARPTPGLAGVCGNYLPHASSESIPSPREAPASVHMAPRRLRLPRPHRWHRPLPPRHPQLSSRTRQSDTKRHRQYPRRSTGSTLLQVTLADTRARRNKAYHLTGLDSIEGILRAGILCVGYRDSRRFVMSAEEIASILAKTAKGLVGTGARTWSRCSAMEYRDYFQCRPCTKRREIEPASLSAASVLP